MMPHKQREESIPSLVTDAFHSALRAARQNANVRQQIEQMQCAQKKPRTILTTDDSLNKRSGWEEFLADGMAFTSFVVPIKQVTGKSAYLKSTSRFFSMVTSMKLKELIVNEDRACAMTRYQLQPPGGAAFESDVAEVFLVKDEKISSLEIYFDSAPFPKPPAAAA